jgi:hypothetical protein
MSDELAQDSADRYDMRKVTTADLCTLWRATNQLETFAEYEQRVTGDPSLEALSSVLRDGEVVALLEIHALPNDEVWIGVSPLGRDVGDGCAVAFFGAIRCALKDGRRRVWVLATMPEFAERLLACGWEMANAIPWQRTDGTSTPAQWIGLSRETWLRAQQAAWN